MKTTRKIKKIHKYIQIFSFLLYKGRHYRIRCTGKVMKEWNVLLFNMSYGDLVLFAFIESKKDDISTSLREFLCFSFLE